MSAALPSTTPTAAPFTWPVRIYWEDTDAGGIVFYANYLKFFERARTEWLRALGLQQSLLRDTHDGMFVVSDTTLRYHQPARLDDQLLVSVTPQDIGRATLTLQQEASLLTPTGQTLLCEGTIRVGWVNSSSLKPARIPSLILELLK
jgi:acyl-CoA thioester hydrolase